MRTEPSVPAGLRPGGQFPAWDPKPRAYLVADIDGTLVGASGQPSPAVVEAVTETSAAGTAVGVATGRMRQAAEPLIATLRAGGPHVLHNGAEVRHDGATVAAWPLSDHQVGTVLRVCRELGAYAEIYLDDGYLVSREDERARPHWEVLGSEPAGLLTAPSELDRTPFKATFALFGDTDPQRVVAGLVDGGLQAGPATSPVTPGITYVNATRRDADKGRALTRAAEHLGCDLGATVAVGDAANDVPMLKVAGTAVAMDGAPDEVVAAAHLVAPPVTEDGAVAALRATDG